MSNFFKRIKRAWEENEYDARNAKRREYPLTEMECIPPMPEPLMPIVSLREAWELFERKRNPHHHAWEFFNYLQHLEKDVPIDQQECNIKFFSEKDI